MTFQYLIHVATVSTCIYIVCVAMNKCTVYGYTCITLLMDTRVSGVYVHVAVHMYACIVYMFLYHTIRFGFPTLDLPNDSA